MSEWVRESIKHDNNNNNNIRYCRHLMCSRPGHNDALLAKKSCYNNRCPANIRKLESKVSCITRSLSHHWLYSNATLISNNWYINHCLSTFFRYIPQPRHGRPNGPLLVSDRSDGLSARVIATSQTTQSVLSLEMTVYLNV